MGLLALLLFPVPGESSDIALELGPEWAKQGYAAAPVALPEPPPPAAASMSCAGFSRGVSAAQAELLARKWGGRGARRIAAWQRFMAGLRRDVAGRGYPDAELLAKVNDFFGMFSFIPDREQWGVEDYWASPAELVASGGGDCEDFAIAKYFALKELGVRAEALRITHVRMGSKGEPHMVLAYYPGGGAAPLIMDNIEGDVLPAAGRKDLLPVFSVNEGGVFVLDRDFSVKMTAPAHRVRIWRDFLVKLERESDYCPTVPARY